MRGREGSAAQNKKIDFHGVFQKQSRGVGGDGTHPVTNVAHTSALMAFSTLVIRLEISSCTEASLPTESFRIRST